MALECFGSGGCGRNTASTEAFRTWLRSPAKQCGGTDAFLRKVNGQNTVRCAVDNSLIYNAAKTETGELPRTARTLRKAIKRGQQARIFDRDLRRCVLCGTEELPLTIGHLLSVEEGRRLGATLEELYSDANLAVMCEACNLGQSERSVSPRMYAAIMVRLVQAETHRMMTPRPRPRPSAEPEARRPSLTTPRVGDEASSRSIG